MASILPPPETQWLDSNGVPLVSGKIFSYIPNSLTFKPTYQDRDQTIANTQPCICNASGRVTMLGSGSYRLIVKDALDNVIMDGLSAASLDMSAISSVMLPVTSSASLATARSLLGVDSSIAAAIAAVSLITGPRGVTGPQGVTGPTGPAGSAATGYVPIFNAGGSLQLPITNTSANFFFQFGSNSTNSGGTASTTFSTMFPNACLGVVASQGDGATGSWWLSVKNITRSGFDSVSSSPLHGGGWQGGSVPFSWLSWGY